MTEASGEIRDLPASADHDRLQSAFSEMELVDVSVLQGGKDETAARRLAEESAASGVGLRGVVWFTADEIERAVDEGVLVLHLWPGDLTDTHGTADAQDTGGTGVAGEVDPGEELLTDVLGLLEKHGLRAVRRDDAVEVEARWEHRDAP